MVNGFSVSFHSILLLFIELNHASFLFFMFNSIEQKQRTRTSNEIIGMVAVTRL